MKWRYFHAQLVSICVGVCVAEAAGRAKGQFGEEGVAQVAERATALAAGNAIAGPATGSPPVLQLPSQIELARLVDLAAQRLRLNIDYDATVLKGTITLRLDGGVSDAELWPFVNRLLASRGFTTVAAHAELEIERGTRSSFERPPAPEGLSAPEKPSAAPPALAQSSSTGPISEVDPQLIHRGSFTSFSVVRISEAPALAKIEFLPNAIELLDARRASRTVEARTQEAGTQGERGAADIAPERAAVNNATPKVPSTSVWHDVGIAPGFRSVVTAVSRRSAKEIVDIVGRAMGRSGASGAGAGSAATVAAGLSVFDENGLILISDLAPRVAQASELVRLLDVPGTPVNIEEIAANNVAASKLVAAVNELAQKQKDAGGGVVGGDLVPSTDDRSVLIIAANEQVGLWKDLLARLDKREPVTTVTYTPRYFAPEEVGDLLEQIVRDAEDDRWKLVINQLLGSLVVTATSSQHQEIRAEIERLDSVTPSARRPVRSFIIKNRSVIEIREILEDLLETGVFDTDDEWRTSALAIGTSNGQPRGVPPDFESRGTVGAGGDAPAEGAVERRTEARGSVPSENTGPRAERSRSRDSGDRRNRLSASASSNSLFEHGEYEQAEDRRLVLSMDEGTNTLIAVGEPRILAQIDALLRSIDVRQPQVMLEVLLVTLSESQSFDLGVELERIRVSDDLQIRLSSLFGLGTRAGSSDRAAGDSAGFTAVVINPGDFSVILRALRTLNNGRSLTIPKLLVDNNERASLNSTLQQPFASVNAGNTVSTTSLGGTLDAGTVVSVQPQIAEGDHLMLNYSVSLSSFVGQSSSATLPPPRQQNSVQSSATIPDGFTVVVGGIEIETLSRAESKIPGLGDIPLLGEAFKSRNRNASRSKFFVFIRANVLRSPGFDDLKFISAQDVKRAGVDDGWPEVKPRVIR